MIEREQNDESRPYKEQWHKWWKGKERVRGTESQQVYKCNKCEIPKWQEEWSVGSSEEEKKDDCNADISQQKRSEQVRKTQEDEKSISKDDKNDEEEKDNTERKKRR